MINQNSRLIKDSKHESISPKKYLTSTLSSKTQQIDQQNVSQQNKKVQQQQYHKTTNFSKKYTQSPQNTKYSKTNQKTQQKVIWVARITHDDIKSDMYYQNNSLSPAKNINKQHYQTQTSPNNNNSFEILHKEKSSAKNFEPVRTQLIQNGQNIEKQLHFLKIYEQINLLKQQFFEQNSTNTNYSYNKPKTKFVQTLPQTRQTSLGRISPPRNNNIQPVLKQFSTKNNFKKNQSTQQIDKKKNKTETNTDNKNQQNQQSKTHSKEHTKIQNTDTPSIHQEEQTKQSEQVEQHQIKNLNPKKKQVKQIDEINLQNGAFHIAGMSYQTEIPKEIQEDNQHQNTQSSSNTIQNQIQQQTIPEVDAFQSYIHPNANHNGDNQQIVAGVDNSTTSINSNTQNKQDIKANSEQIETNTQNTQNNPQIENIQSEQPQELPQKTQNENQLQSETPTQTNYTATEALPKEEATEIKVDQENTEQKYNFTRLQQLNEEEPSQPINPPIQKQPSLKFSQLKKTLESKLANILQPKKSETEQNHITDKNQEGQPQNGTYEELYEYYFDYYNKLDPISTNNSYYADFYASHYSKLNSEKLNQQKITSLDNLVSQMLLQRPKVHTKSTSSKMKNLDFLK